MEIKVMELPAGIRYLSNQEHTKFLISKAHVAEVVTEIGVPIGRQRSKMKPWPKGLEAIPCCSYSQLVESFEFLRNTAYRQGLADAFQLTVKNETESA